MISKCIVFLVGSVALAGCCVSGNGCYAPVVGAPTAPIAWDGLGSPPTETADVPESRPKKTTRPKKEIIVGPIGDVSAGANRKSQADVAQPADSKCASDSRRNAQRANRAASWIRRSA